MPYLTANTMPIIQGKLTLPRVGRYTATLKLAAPQADVGFTEGSAVTIEFDGGQTFETTCTRLGQDGAYATALLVAGANGLPKTLERRFYQGIPRYIVLGDILRDCGEQVDSIDAPQVSDWTRLAGQATKALMAALEDTDLSWRMLPDGRVWIGRETYPPHPNRLQVFSSTPDKGRWLLEADPTLLPGSKLDVVHLGAERVLGVADLVIQHVGQKLRTEVWV
jgi:hypothetical protein